MHRTYWTTLLLVLGVSAASHAEFTFQDDGGKTLTVLEDGQKVLGYNYGRIDPPEGVPERYWRSSYIHPLYGPDGEVMTQDFPKDHFHHRGLYWTWPRCKVGDREMDLWTIVGAHQLFQEWKTKEAGPDKAEVAVENAWLFDDDPKPKVREDVRFVVHPADAQGRFIDFELVFTNVCEEKVTIRGQTDGDKGYGGFCYRPDAARKPMTFTAANGVEKEDVLTLNTPWADVSFPSKPDGPVSGLAIFQHAGNPGYPDPGWLFRHYGFLGASWPHLAGYELAPGASVTLRYRVYVHRGDAEAAEVAGRFKAYAETPAK